jgi:fumarylacetoacetase
MPPLGPFIGKNFGTSISPWVVTPDALAPFKTSPSSLSQAVENHLKVGPFSTYDIRMKAEIIAGGTHTVTCESTMAELYWTLPQAIAHLTSAGCGLRTGDIVATGTVSGRVAGQFGCLLESTEGGRVPIALKDGSQRHYLENEDTVELSATAGGKESGIGFGGCIGQLAASKGV